MTTPIAHAFNPGDVVYVIDTTPCTSGCSNRAFVGPSSSQGVLAVRKGTILAMNINQQLQGPPVVVYTLRFGAATGSKDFTETMQQGNNVFAIMFNATTSASYHVASITPANLFTSPATKATFTIAGSDLTTIFTPGSKFTVTTTTNNVDNGTFTVVTSSYNTSTTTTSITVVENLPVSDNTGTISIGLAAALAQYGLLVA